MQHVKWDTMEKTFNRDITTLKIGEIFFENHVLKLQLQPVKVTPVSHRITFHALIIMLFEDVTFSCFMSF